MKYFWGTTCFACYDKNLIRSLLKLDRNYPFTAFWVAIFGVAEISFVIFQLVYRTVKHACKVSKIRTINGAWQWVSPTEKKFLRTKKDDVPFFYSLCLHKMGYYSEMFLSIAMPCLSHTVWSFANSAKLFLEKLKSKIRISKMWW